MIRYLLLVVPFFTWSCSTGSKSWKQVNPGNYSLMENSEGLEEVLDEQDKADVQVLAEEQGIVITGLKKSTRTGPFSSFSEVLPLLQQETEREFLVVTFGKSYWNTTPSIDSAAQFFADEGWQRVLFLVQRGWGVVVLRDYHANPPAN